MTTSPLLTRFRLALQRSDTIAPLGLAVAVGVVAGLGAIALRWMVRGAQWVFFDQGTRLGPDLGLPVPEWAVTVAARA